MIDFARLAMELLASARELVPAWLPGGRISGHEYVCASVQGGAGRSFSVNLTTGKFADFSSDLKGGDLIALYAAIHNLSQGEAATHLGAEPAKINGSGGHALMAEPEQEPQPPPMEPWPPDFFRHFKYGHPDDIWIYRDATREPLFAVVRYNPPAEKKQIVPWIYNGLKWTAKAPPKPRPLYGLDRLAELARLPVLLVEGEKAADAAQAYFPGRPCLTWMGGVSGAAHAQWTPLAGLKVDLWPDADEPGRACMAKIAGKLLSIGCTVRVVDTDTLPDSWDIADAAAEGWDKARLMDYARAHIRAVALPDAEPAARPAPARVARNQTLPTSPATIIEHDPGPGSQAVMWANWGLQKKASGIPYPHMHNIARIIAARPHDQQPRYNEFTQRPVAGGQPWSDPMTLEALDWLQSTAGLYDVRRQTVEDAVLHVAQRNKFNPLRDWMESLKWNGVETLKYLFHKGFGTKWTAYTSAVSENFMIGMVARVFKPGCKVDSLPVLEGSQGKKKSSAFIALAGEEYFAEIHERIGSKDFYLGLSGKMLVEIPELHTIRRENIELAKGVITTAIDRYRMPYGHFSADYRRTCVFCGTTNHDDWNVDETGARRFWPLRCGIIDIEWIKTHRDQLFAEAVHMYQGGAQWWIVPESEAAIQREARRATDPWEAIIAPYLDANDAVQTNDILRDVLQLKMQEVNSQLQKRVTAILRARGFVNTFKNENGRGRRSWIKPSGEE